MQLIISDTSSKHHIGLCGLPILKILTFLMQVPFDYDIYKYARCSYSGLSFMHVIGDTFYFNLREGLGSTSSELC